MASIIPVGARWRAQVRRKGHATQTQTFATRRLAEAWARQAEGDIEAGRAGLPQPHAGATTLAKLIERYTESVGKAKPFGRNKADVLRRLASRTDGLGAVPVASLSVARVVRYITEDRQISGVTASIDLTYLAGVLKVARALWHIEAPRGVVDDAREVLRHMGRLQRSAERDRRPTPDELARLRGWLACHSRSLTPDVFDFILDSCFRPPSEITRLRWADLHTEDRTIVITDRKDPRRKHGNHQVVPLLGRCMEIIQRQPVGGELIFPVNGHSWSSIFPRACADLGIDDLRLYDLRHEAITRLVEAGRHSFAEMMHITGHRDPKQLMRYTQLRAKDLHRADPAPTHITPTPPPPPGA